MAMLISTGSVGLAVDDVRSTKPRIAGGSWHVSPAEKSRSTQILRQEQEEFDPSWRLISTCSKKGGKTPRTITPSPSLTGSDSRIMIILAECESQAAHQVACTQHSGLG